MKNAPHLISGEQQDAQEFLAYFLDVLHEDLNRADSRSTTGKTQLSSQEKKEEEEETKKVENFEKIAFLSWKEHLLRNRSIVVDLMQGQLRSRLKCLDCGTESVKFDSFMFMSVPLPKKRRGHTISLDDCFTEFSRIEILEGEDMWLCSSCKKPKRTEKTIDIWKLPTVLICVVKRFYFSK